MDTQQSFPESYLSFVINDDRYLEARTEIENAKKDAELMKNMPLALQGDTPLQPKSLKGPESDFYELEQLEQQNITTVLVENLFTELAVMLILLEEHV